MLLSSKLICCPALLTNCRSFQIAPLLFILDGLVQEGNNLLELYLTVFEILTEILFVFNSIFNGLPIAYCHL